VFELNVRLGLGKTRINKELADTIRQEPEHALFPAYHNGLTLLTRELHEEPGRILLSGVSVVNGCQSLLALFGNRQYISPQLRILVKIVELGESLSLVDKITYRTNNQNPVNIRDQRSTDPIQRDLQAQVLSKYGTTFGYTIRSGERIIADAVIDNATAAQLIMAVYLGEPWNAVRKVKLFDQDYHRVFARNIDANRLFLLYTMNSALTDKRSELRNDVESSFASVRFTLLFLLTQLLRITSTGQELVANPGRWLPDLAAEVRCALDDLATEVIESVNFYLDAKDDENSGGAPFDAKVAFKSKTGVQQIERDAVQAGRRALRRDKNYGFNLPPFR
jgi:hypothetical protein